MPDVPSAIATVDELMALADDHGNIRTDRDVWGVGDLNVRNLYVGGHLSAVGDLNVSGNLSVVGDLSIRGYLSVENDLTVGGNLYVRGNLSVVGDLSVEGYLNVRGDLSVGGNLSVGRDLNVRGNLSVEGYLNVEGHLAWSHSSIPSVGGTMRHGAVHPPEWQRDHWSRRLGIELRGCYSDIAKQVAPHLDEWLAQDKWSETERWIIQSWKDAQEATP